MNIHAGIKRGIASGMLLFLAVVSLAAGPTRTVQGTVEDLGRLKSSAPGIESVLVSVLDENGAKIGETVTDGQGRYRLDGMPDGKTVTVTHDKLGFKDRPTEVKDVRLSSDLKPLHVLMIREVEGEAYYQAVAEAIKERATEQSPGYERDLKILETLDEERRILVIEHLGSLKTREESTTPVDSLLTTVPPPSTPSSEPEIEPSETVKQSSSEAIILTEPVESGTEPPSPQPG